MIDIKLVRSNPDYVKAAVRKREMDLDAVIDEILQIDAERRELSGKTDALKAQQNAASKQIPQIKKEGGDVSKIMAEMKELSTQIKEADVKIGELENKQKELIYAIPNLPDEDLAAGGKENNAV
ncbi:MAG: serine--tRNA ligase, partial [Clostridia bacterium]|nr:serine--tRNA ligase [Clostridia bacterium]